MLHNKLRHHYNIIQITRRADVVEEGIVILGPKQGAWEHDCMEWNVVLGHKLVELDLLGVLPPALPVFRVAGCDGQVAGKEGSRVIEVVASIMQVSHI